MAKQTVKTKSTKFGMTLWPHIAGL